MVVDHPKEHIAILAVILTSVLADDAKRIVESSASCLEAHAVLLGILRSFSVVPFEVIVFHNTTT